MAINNFIITRKDQDADRVTLETEGLTIGRLTGNDLVLNHPTVSRTHAGIKEVNGDYWVFNLSNANGTLLNGALVDNVPLADDDLIQIGPYFLRATHTSDGLALQVEMSIKPLPIVPSGTDTLQPTGEAAETLILDRRLPVLGEASMSFSVMGGPDEQALKVFWDKRKREAGKLDLQSPLKPRDKFRLGKARYNWRPTSDLQRSWPPAVFVWSAMIITALALAAALTFKDAYSPGALSAAHARANFLLAPPIALGPNSASCTTCHSSRASMQQNCASCHTTQAFVPSISDKHTAVGLVCTDCHIEHRGRDFRPALVASTGCMSCHHDGAVSHGKQLRTPHGGTLGYPVSNGKWEWAGVTEAEWQRKGLRGLARNHDLMEQFHLVHIAGRREGRANCSDCHNAGFEGDAVRQGVRELCATCHAVNYEAASTKEAGPGCVVCHAQHGEEKGLKASLRRLELGE